jgi:hypothetical protein
MSYTEEFFLKEMSLTKITIYLILGIFILSNLDAHKQSSVVLLNKIPLHVSGWFAHHQEVYTYTVHTANCPSLSSLLSLVPLGVITQYCTDAQSIPNGNDDARLEREDQLAVCTVYV